MNWKIFLYRAELATDIPFDILIAYIKKRANKGDRFKLSASSDERVRFFYSYRQGLFDKLGYYAGPVNELVINRTSSDQGNVTIDFKFPNSVMIAFGLIAVFILSMSLFVIPDFGLLGSGIVLLTMYFWGMVRLNSQFYYLKSDLEQMSENYKRHIGQ